VTRWKDLNNEGVRLLQGGDVAGALAAFEEAYEESADDTESRASTLVNLSAVVDMTGDPDRAVELLAEAAGLTKTQLAVVLAARAEILTRLGRWDEAWQDIDRGLANAAPREYALLGNVKTGQLMVEGRLTEAREAALATAEIAAAHMPGIAVHAHTNLARIEQTLGQFGEAAAQAQIALDLAYQDVPQLVPSLHMTLADIAGSTGDPTGSAEHFGLARDLSAAMGDQSTEGLALVSLARLAYLASDNDRADTLYDEAAKLLRASGNSPGLAACQHGRAAVRIGHGRPREALKLLDGVLDALTGPTERVAVYQVQGSALEALGEFARADECYGSAMEVSEQVGLWHVTMGIAWWRADALVRWALSVTGDQRRELSRRALDFALPAALAAEAVRQRFPHGPMRERWVALASAPLIRSAFNAIRAVGDVELVAAYIDHLTATVFLDGASPVARDELVSLPLPPPVEETHLPYAASFFASTGGLSPVGFALPPRVRIDPAVPSALDTWIDAAEQRYGLRVRSAQVVSSW
jgi:tetratricopeptide (TPR) repeat protein